MKLAFDASADLWLENFIPTGETFDWDKGNIHKNLKHCISDEEIESIFWMQEFVLMGKVIDPPQSEWRGIILGLTETEKLVTLVFTLRNDRLRPISCRVMRPSERRYYEEIIEEERSYD